MAPLKRKSTSSARSGPPKRQANCSNNSIPDSEVEDEQHESVNQSPETKVIRVEIARMDGHSFDRDFDTDDLKLLWTQGLEKDLNLLRSTSSFRVPSGLLRANFRLKLPVILKDFVRDPFISFLKVTQDERHTFSGKVLDLDGLPPAKIGETVSVTVRNTHVEAERTTIDAWLSFYGTIVGSSRFIIVDNLETDQYVVNLQLKSLIPEYLPIWGMKARIYYHGIPKLCNNCYTLGHLKSQCNSEKKSWWDFIEILRASGIPDEIFGTWLSCNNKTAVLESHNPAPSIASTSTPVSINNQDQAIAQLSQQIAHLKELVKDNTPARGNRPYRGRGRASRSQNWGRGHQSGNQSQVIDLTYSPPSGRGRGSNHSHRPFRGRGRGVYRRGNNNHFDY